MRRILMSLVFVGLTSTFLGCGGSDTPQGKELEDLQNKAQQQVDNEERAYQKEQQQQSKKK